MKKLLPFALLIILLFCSCNEKKDFLAYQQKNPVLECTVNDKFELIISKGDSIKITVLKPDEINGICFEFNGNSALAISGNTKIPLDRISACGLFALAGCMNLENDSIVAVSDSGKSSIITFENDLGTYIVTYGKNLLPSHIEIHSDKFDYDILVTGIELSSS